MLSGEAQDEVGCARCRVALEPFRRSGSRSGVAGLTFPEDSRRLSVILLQIGVHLLFGAFRISILSDY